MSSRDQPERAPRTTGGARSPWIDPKWAWHYRQLLTLRDRLARDTETKLHEAAEPLEPHSLHAGDSATDEFDHDVALALLAAEQNALNEVNDALLRIERGKYGICEETGVKIPAARLRALPWCRYAREVEQRLEQAGTVPRPRLPPVISLRGPRPDIPDSGDLPREGAAEEESTEPEEIATAKVIDDVSSTKEEEGEGSASNSEPARTRSREG